MIKSALIAFGLSAGAVGAQGVLPSAPLLETCGGTRLVLEADGAPDTDALSGASKVISARVAAKLDQQFDYTDVVDGQVHVSFATGMAGDGAMIAPLLADINFGFHTIRKSSTTGLPVDLEDAQVLLPYRVDPSLSFVIDTDPFLDGAMIAQARLVIDDTGLPTVAYMLTAEGTGVLADYTTANIGQQVAIVSSNQILSAYFVRAANTSGIGVIDANGSGLKDSGLTLESTIDLAASLQGGVLPFDLTIVDEIRVDGSNPSADFCP